MYKASQITKIAMIAGIYAALTLAIPILSYQVFQFRISEALTILPVYTVAAIPGLAIGCALANLIGFVAGFNPIGLVDALFGSVASLIAAILTYMIGKSPKKWVRYCFVPLPAVLINAVIIGLELTFVFSTPFNFMIFLANALSVLIGQAVICYGLGVPLLILIDKNKFLQKILK